MIIKDLKGVNCIGIIDRIEGQVAVLETIGGFIHMDISLFPFRPSEGMHIQIKDGQVSQDKLAEEQAGEKAIRFLSND